jgi:hypothetical protein
VGSNSHHWYYPHNEPETGVNSWGARHDNVGRGWHMGRTLPGATGWSRYNQAEHRNKVTVDVGRTTENTVYAFAYTQSELTL